jgi:tRNA(Ile)-lysidine synthase
VERTLREERLIEPGTRALVAVSGGPDSMALAHVLWRLRESMGFEVSAFGVDHGLRQAAVSELQLAGRFLGSLGMTFTTVRVMVGHGPNLMARAREARLQALRLEAERQGAARIAIGHHADDRAETLLIRILQGSGPCGLAVLPACAGQLIRPLIRAKRGDIMLHLERHGVPFASDPTNEDRHHLRASIRLDVLPTLKRLSPRVVEHLCDLADDLQALGVGGDGSPVFKRSQLRALAQGASRGTQVRVALPGGRVARIDPEAGLIVVDGAQEAAVRPPSNNSTPK